MPSPSEGIRRSRTARSGGLPTERMTYAVKELFYSVQGEGANTGRPAVFCRFAGCNLWSGREDERENAICRFCDTDFFGIDGTYGGRYDAEGLADAIERVCLGGR